MYRGNRQTNYYAHYPQGKQFFLNGNKKHYQFSPNEIEILEIFKSPEQHLHSSNRMDPSDIQGAVPGTLVSKALKNKQRAQKYRQRQNRTPGMHSQSSQKVINTNQYVPRQKLYSQLEPHTKDSLDEYKQQFSNKLMPSHQRQQPEEKHEAAPQSSSQLADRQRQDYQRQFNQYKKNINKITQFKHLQNQHQSYRKETEKSPSLPHPRYESPQVNPLSQPPLKNIQDYYKIKLENAVSDHLVQSSIKQNHRRLNPTYLSYQASPLLGRGYKA